MNQFFVKVIRWAKYPAEKKMNTLYYWAYKVQFAFEKISTRFVFSKSACDEDDLPLSLGVSLAHSNEYRACSIPLLRLMVKRALEAMSGSGDGFVDVGCGKGAACIYAYKYFSFNKIIGIDFSENLVMVARENAAIAGIDCIEWQNNDAQTWKIPDRRSVVFMYNPFDAMVMEKFINNNMDHFIRYRSIICYVNAFNAQVLLEHGFVFSEKSLSERNAIFELAASG